MSFRAHAVVTLETFVSLCKRWQETVQVPVLLMLKCFHLLGGWAIRSVIYGCIWAKSACFIFQWMCMHEPDHSWLLQTVAPSLTSVRKVLPSAPQPIPHPQTPTGTSVQRSSFLVGDIRYWRWHWFQGSVSSRPDCNFPDSSPQHNTGHITHSLWQHFL